MSLPCEEGRSPRVRGSPESHTRMGLTFGSIPACAGEPALGLGWGGLSKVDPHVCGGADVFPL